MNSELVNQIANAILYEGYILYPYRRSAIKNQQRWNFGVLYPRSYAEAQTGHDAWSMQTECLALVDSGTQLTVVVRFLHQVERVAGKILNANDLSYEQVDSLEIGSETFQSWQEACEREGSISCGNITELARAPQTLPFSFPAGQTKEMLRDGEKVAGVMVRRNETVAGEISVSAQHEAGSLYKIRVLVTNRSEFEPGENDREQALMKSLLSAHAVLCLRQGEFISLLDPPEEFRSVGTACRNVGCWPVLVGTEGERDTMLASPIILYDYPRVAAESRGDLFDGTEIDEILSLRIMGLTDDEKRQMAAADDRSREILRRTEELAGEQLMKMHGTLRSVDHSS